MNSRTNIVGAFILVLLAQRWSSAQSAPEPTMEPATVSPTAAPSPSQHPTPVPTGTSPGLVVRVDELPPLTIQGTASTGGWTAREVIPSIAGGLGFVAALASIVVTLMVSNRALGQRQNELRRSMIKSSNEAELRAIQTSLDTFYGPYLQLSETNALLAREFISRQPDSSTFRTLPALLDPERRKQLQESTNDWTIVSEIVRIDAALDRLIRKNAGMLDETIGQYLARVSSHYRIIRLAHQGKLAGDPEGRFAEYYVYTWQLDKVLKLEIARLRHRSRLLRDQPDEVHPPLEPLSIPEELALGPWPDPRGDWPAKPTARPTPRSQRPDVV